MNQVFSKLTNNEIGVRIPVSSTGKAIFLCVMISTSVKVCGQHQHSRWAGLTSFTDAPSIVLRIEPVHANLAADTVHSVHRQPGKNGRYLIEQHSSTSPLASPVGGPDFEGLFMLALLP